LRQAKEHESAIKISSKYQCNCKEPIAKSIIRDNQL